MNRPKYHFETDISLRKPLRVLGLNPRELWFETGNLRFDHTRDPRRVFRCRLHVVQPMTHGGTGLKFVDTLGNLCRQVTENPEHHIDDDGIHDQCYCDTRQKNDQSTFHSWEEYTLSLARRERVPKHL